MIGKGKENHMRIIFIGMKSCGKTTSGKLLAKRLDITFIDSDTVIEILHTQERGEILPFRAIFQQYGAAYFHQLETRALQQIAQEYAEKDVILSCGGQAPLRRENQEILSRLGTIVFLQVEKSVLLKRILARGIPASFPYPDDAEKSLTVLMEERLPIYQALADLTTSLDDGPREESVDIIQAELQDYAKH